MAQQTINIGTVANDNTGDPLRDAFDKVNDNFDELYLADATIAITINPQTGLTYDPLLTDAGAMITMDNAAANAVTIPANASVAYPIGTELHFQQLGAGATTIAITTDTLNVNAALTLVLNGQFAVATALKITATTWTLFGNLVAV